MEQYADELLSIEKYLNQVYNASYPTDHYREAHAKFQKKFVPSLLWVALAVAAYILPYWFIHSFWWVFLIFAAMNLRTLSIMNREQKKAKEEDKANRKLLEKRENARQRHRQLTQKLLQMKQAHPELGKYTFFFETPYQSETMRRNSSGEWYHAGEIKLTQKDGLICLEGFEKPIQCTYHQLAGYVTEGTVCVFADSYPKNHPQEMYTVEKIYSHDVLPVQETQVFRVRDSINVWKRMDAYAKKLNGLERDFFYGAGAGYATNEELCYSGKISSDAYFYNESSRRERMENMRSALEAYNEAGKQEIQVTTAVTHFVFAAGYVVYNQENKVVMVLLNRHSQVLKIKCRLPKKQLAGEFRLKDHRAMTGEVIEFTADEKNVGLGTEYYAMDYVYNLFADSFPRFRSLGQHPYGMNDREWRIWFYVNMDHR